MRMMKNVYIVVVVASMCVTISTSSPEQRLGHHALKVLERLGLARDTSRAEVRLEQGRPGDSPIYYIRLPPLPYYYAQNSIHPVETTPHPFQRLPVDFTNNGRPDQVYHWTTPSPFWPSTTVFQDAPTMPHIQFVPAVAQHSPSNDIPEFPLAHPIPASFIDNSQLSPPMHPIISEIMPSSISTSFQNTATIPGYSKPQYTEHIQMHPIIVPSKKPSVISMKKPITPPFKKPGKFPPAQQTVPISNQSLSKYPPSYVNGNPQFNDINSLSKPWLTIGKEKGMYLYNGKPDNIYIWRPRPTINPAKYKHPMFSHFNY